MISTNTPKELNEKIDLPIVNTIEDISQELEVTSDQELHLTLGDEENIHGEHEDRPNFEALAQEDEEKDQKAIKTPSTLAHEERFEEAQNKRRQDLVSHLHEHFYVKNEKFFYKEPQLASKVAFVDQDKKIATTSNDPRISHALVDLAEAKGWEKLKVTGNDKFKRQVWLEASARGIEVQGYQPTEQDLVKLNQRKTEIEQLHSHKNVIEQVVTKAIDHSTTNSHNKKILGTALQQKLQQTDKLPTVLTYDKTAASQSKDQNTSRQIDLNKERTR